jgi:hypothetical protein
MLAFLQARLATLARHVLSFSGSLSEPIQKLIEANESVVIL